MLDDANPLPNPFPIPSTSCGEGDGHYNLHYETETSWSGGLNLTNAWVECSDGDERIDLAGKAADLTEEQKQKVQDGTEELISDLGDVGDDVPTDPDELESVANDASHPVTATILGRLVPLAAEVSVGGVYSMVTTILRTIIYSPSAWTYLPAIVYVIFSHGQAIAGSDLEGIHAGVDDLNTKLEAGEITQDEYAQSRKEVVQEQFAS